MNLSNLQTKIVNNEDNVIFVEAAAASGKTAIIVEKIKKELAKDKHYKPLKRYNHR